MARPYFLLGMALFAVALLGCQNSGAEDTAEPDLSIAQEPKRVIVMGIDETGSYNLWKRAKSMGFDIIRGMQPGDIFYCRRITARSYLDKCAILRLELPYYKQDKNGNPFDRKAKNLRRSHGFQIDMMKKDACIRLDAALNQNAQLTDIFGFLAAASDKFSLAPVDFQRYLIIASDLVDNVKHRVKLDLSGASVAVLGFQSSEDPGKTQKLKGRWTKTFTDAGATEVIFLPPEETFTMDLFKGA